MTETSAINPPKCPHCGGMHETTCPTIKAIEYFPDGMVKRVEFKTANDYPPLVAGSASGPVSCCRYPQAGQTFMPGYTTAARPVIS